MAQETLTKIVEFKEWKGIDNVAPDDMRLDVGYVRVANNVDIDNSAMMHRRKGVSQRVLYGRWHSGWTNGTNYFAVVDGDLVEVNLNWSTTIILAEVGYSRMNFVQVGKRTFFTNSDIIGVIEDGTVYPFPEINQEFKEKMIGGDLIEYYNARLYVAQDKEIYFSDAVNPMVMDSRKNFILTGGPITMLKAVEDGIYVSASGKTFFMHGDDPSTFKYKALLDVPAIQFSAISFEKEVITYAKRGTFAGKTVIFSTTDGIFMGHKSGALEDLTGKHYGVLDIDSGCSFIRWDKVRQQYIFIGEPYPEISFNLILPGILASFEGTTT